MDRLRSRSRPSRSARRTASSRSGSERVTDETFAIVGASLAGGTAAATLREEGFNGRLVLIGAEELPPYERPPLSKEYLRGEQSLDEAFLRPSEWYEQHAIE